MNRPNVAISFLTILSVCPVLSAGNNVEDAKALLERAAQTYEALHSFDFEGTSIAEAVQGGNTTRSEVDFVVAYQSPNKMRLEYQYRATGDWIKVSDGEFLLVARTLTNDARRTPATEQTLETLKSSPIFAIQHLGEAAENPYLSGSETIEVGGRQTECTVIRFAIRALALRPSESAATTTVWIDKQSGLIVRQVTEAAGYGDEPSQHKRTTIVLRFKVNGALQHGRFLTTLFHGEKVHDEGTISGK